MSLEDVDHAVYRYTLLFAEALPPGFELEGHFDGPVHAAEYGLDRICRQRHNLIRAMSDKPLVLLVDDFEDAREMYAAYLEFCGMRVVCAEGGLAAVDSAREQRPDLILMDLQMPGVTGFDAMRTLRSDTSFARVPIVALTAHALEREQKSAVKAGFDAVIPKPCLPDELFRMVAEILASWRPDLRIPRDC